MHPEALRKQDLETKVAYLIDRLEIEALFTRYCRALDRRDVPLLEEIYHPDATETHGGFSGSYRDFIDRYVPPLWDGSELGVHYVSNSMIEIAGDRARAESYAFVISRTVDATAAGQDRLMAARYLDRIERRNGGPWRIADRVVVFDWAQVFAFEKVPDFPPANYLRGTRGDADLSYALFARAAGS